MSEVKKEKTRLVRIPAQRFDFLGYTLGVFYAKAGQSYIGTAISKKSISRLFEKIHDETSRRWLEGPVEKRVLELNRLLRGWCGYFDQGPIYEPYRRIRKYTERRLRRWLMKKHKRRGTGYRHSTRTRTLHPEARPIQPA